MATLAMACWIGPVLSAHQNTGTITSEGLWASMWGVCRGKVGRCQVQSVHTTIPSEIWSSYLARSLCTHQWQRVAVCVPL